MEQPYGQSQGRGTCWICIPGASSSLSLICLWHGAANVHAYVLAHAARICTATTGAVLKSAVTIKLYLSLVMLSRPVAVNLSWKHVNSRMPFLTQGYQVYTEQADRGMSPVHSHSPQPSSPHSLLPQGRGSITYGPAGYSQADQTTYAAQGYSQVNQALSCQHRL